MGRDSPRIASYQIQTLFFFFPHRRAGLTLSLFERMVIAGCEPRILDTQYRMHPAISQFPSDAFYGGRIKDGIGAEARPPPAGIDWPRKDFPVMFITADGARETSADATSKENSVEANIVMDVVQRLVRAGLALDEIGVVTPYGAQVFLARA